MSSNSDATPPYQPRAPVPPCEPQAQAAGTQNPDHRPIELPVLNDSGLAAQGWQRRHTTDAARAAEAVELYESLGFEVRTERVDPAQLDSRCAPCADSAGAWLVVIYTRKHPAD